MADFFISFNRADSTWAEWIAWQLEDAGFTVTFQLWDFQPGRNFIAEMDKATRGSERTIAVLSPNYLRSGFGSAEWMAAFRQDPNGEKGKLIPIRVEDFELDGLLAEVIYIDIVGLDEQLAIERLRSGVAQRRAKPARAPRFPGAAAKNKPAYPGTPQVVVLDESKSSQTQVVDAVTEAPQREGKVEQGERASTKVGASRVKQWPNTMWAKPKESWWRKRRTSVGVAATIGVIAIAVYYLFSREPKQVQFSELSLVAKSKSDYHRVSGKDSGLIVLVDIIPDQARSAGALATVENWAQLIAADQTFESLDIYSYTISVNRLSIGDLAALTRESKYHLDDVRFRSYKKFIFLCHGLGCPVVVDWLNDNYFFSNKKEYVEKVEMMFLFSPLFRIDIQSHSLAAMASAKQSMLWNALPSYVRTSTYCAYETRPTDGKIVSEGSSSFCSRPPLLINADHFGIFNPTSQSDSPYLAFKNAFLETRSRKPRDVVGAGRVGQ